MIKGHSDQEHANIRSTKTKPLPHPTPASPLSPTAPADNSPSSGPPTLKTRFLYADSQPATGQIYTDSTSRFLTPSISGNQFILVLYYDSNFIHADPMKNRTKEEHLAAYQ